MLKQALIDLRDYIKSKNPYFDVGYDNVRMDDEEGWILAEINETKTPVFPADNLGNYFYLRLPSKVTFQYSPLYSGSDNSQGVGVVTPVILVACVRDADADNLCGNLVTTIGKYCDTINTRITSAIVHNEDVVVQEMAHMKEEIPGTLQAMLDEMTMISISFTVIVPFKFQNFNCLPPVCSTC